MKKLLIYLFFYVYYQYQHLPTYISIPTRLKSFYLKLHFSIRLKLRVVQEGGSDYLIIITDQAK